MTTYICSDCGDGCVLVVEGVEITEPKYCPFESNATWKPVKEGKE